MRCRGSDTHHLQYEAREYRTPLEKDWRELDCNKVQLPRCVHNAIHASGYKPDKPSRQEMVEEIWEHGSQRATDELNRQLEIGYMTLGATLNPLYPENEGA
jgi:hypothetical protein